PATSATAACWSAGRAGSAPGSAACASTRPSPSTSRRPPVALQAALDAADQVEAGHDAALEQWRRQAEQARYAATRAERRYRAVDPENRLVARGLEAEWEAALQAAQAAEAELDRREAARPVRLSTDERAKILAIATDLPALWAAPSHHRPRPQGTPARPPR